METLRDFILGGSKITADGDCSHEIKSCLLLGRKVMTNLDSTLKSRDITFPTKVHLVKAMVFTVVMYGCESWTIKKPEHWRTDAFELWSWRRLLRVPWTARKSNQSILKEISLEFSLEGLMLKLKLQYFGHLMWRADSFEKTLMLGKIEGGRRRGQQRMRWLDDVTDSMDVSLSKLQEFTQTHVHWVSDAIQPSHPLLPTSPPAFSLSSRSFQMSQFFTSGGQRNWSFSFSISPSSEYSGLISFRMDWLDLLAVQGTLKSLLQHHSSKASILQCSGFFINQLSHPYMTTGKTRALTRQTFWLLLCFGTETILTETNWN